MLKITLKKNGEIFSKNRWILTYKNKNDYFENVEVIKNKRR